MIEIHGWPLVWMHFAGPIQTTALTEWLTACDALLARQTEFVVVTETAAGLILPQDYRSQEAQWYKRQRTAVARYCQGVARVVTDASQHRMRHPNEAGLWPCPLLITSDPKEARAWAAQRLEAKS